MPSPLLPRAVLRIGLMLALAVVPAAHAITTQPVAVYSRTMNGYARFIDGNNQFRPETFVFAEGLRLDGNMADVSIDRVPFNQVAQMVARALEEQNYFPMPYAKHVDLLIVLSWGTTTGAARDNFAWSVRSLANTAFRSAGPDLRLTNSAVDTFLSLNDISNQERDRLNHRNAQILGYTAELRDAEFVAPCGTWVQDVVSDVEENRYFVVLKAYDFQLVRKEKQWKELWETRFSIRQSGNRFDRELPTMAKYAMRFAGQNVGLIRRPVSSGKVEVGTPTIVEMK